MPMFSRHVALEVCFQALSWRKDVPHWPWLTDLTHECFRIFGQGPRVIYKRSVSYSCRWPDRQLTGKRRVVYQCCIFLLCAAGLRKAAGVDHRLCSRCFLAAAERGFAFLTRGNLLCPGFCFPRVCQLFRANYNSEIRLEALWVISKVLTEHDKSRPKSLQQEPEAPFQSFVFRTATNRKK